MALWVKILIPLIMTIAIRVQTRQSAPAELLIPARIIYSPVTPDEDNLFCRRMTTPAYQSLAR